MPSSPSLLRPSSKAGTECTPQIGVDKRCPIQEQAYWRWPFPPAFHVHTRCGLGGRGATSGLQLFVVLLTSGDLMIRRCIGSM